jgi:hypothetical protein
MSFGTMVTVGPVPVGDHEAVVRWAKAQQLFSVVGTVKQPDGAVRLGCSSEMKTPFGGPGSFPMVVTVAGDLRFGPDT